MPAGVAVDATALDLHRPRQHLGIGVRPEAIEAIATIAANIDAIITAEAALTAAARAAAAAHRRSGTTEAGVAVGSIGAGTDGKVVTALGGRVVVVDPQEVHWLAASRPPRCSTCCPGKSPPTITSYFSASTRQCRSLSRARRSSRACQQCVPRSSWATIARSASPPSRRTTRSPRFLASTASTAVASRSGLRSAGALALFVAPRPAEARSPRPDVEEVSPLACSLQGAARLRARDLLVRRPPRGAPRLGRARRIHCIILACC
mmetsp:Transcript_90654/g.194393  ORF Transcript_90654/g.194393 Transcript_90654/m.194393 type:complete len:263 (+) Transcript_90654:820-1608(+)